MRGQGERGLPTNRLKRAGARRDADGSLPRSEANRHGSLPAGHHASLARIYFALDLAGHLM